MDRRTFLKGLFVAAVTPASCVRALYQPTVGLSEKDLCDIITATLEDLKYDPEQKPWINFTRLYSSPKGDRNV